MSRVGSKRPREDSPPRSTGSSLALGDGVYQVGSAEQTQPAKGDVASKRPREDSPPRTTSSLLALGDGVYQVCSTKQTHLAMGDGDLYKAFDTVGTAIVDISADMGRFRDGILLQGDSRAYIGFASPSRYSAMQLSSSLQMFHDCAHLELLPYFQQLDMVKFAKNPQPSTLLCIRVDFSLPDSYFSGASETLDAVRAFINRRLSKAIVVFRDQYRDILPSTQYPQNGASGTLATFLDWLAANGTDTKLFIAVHHAHQVLERPFDAGYWARCRPPAVDLRLDILHELLLKPIWSSLSSEQGVVRKFLIVGSYLLREIFVPPEPDAFPGLPEFSDLTDYDALHGFTSPHIRTIYSLPHSVMPTDRLGLALRHCNTVASPADPSSLAREFPGIYTKESLESVLRPMSAQRSVLDEKVIHTLPVYKAYLNDTHEKAARALYPLLLRNAAFRSKAEGMLHKVGRLSRSSGLVFSIHDLLNDTPEDDQLFARVFMLGLMRKFEFKEGSQTRVYYDLAGGCARALIQKLIVYTEPENYKAEYFKRDPSPAYVDHAPNAKMDFNIDTFKILTLTEKSIATLILEFFRPLKHYKQLPKLEETFQATMAKLYRAALFKLFNGHMPFVNAVQIEMAYRHRGNLFADLIVKITIPGHIELFAIHEYKLFDPAKTMNGTHAHLQAPRRLESQNLRDARTMPAKDDDTGRRVPINSRTAWYNAMQYFLKEIASMRNLPPHWFFDDSSERETVDLPFPLSIEDICAFFFRKQDDMEDSPLGKDDVKRAVEVAAEAVTQVGQYADVATLGVADHLAVIGEPNTMGWADKRITSLGPGRTIIVPFAIVSVAGALAYVEKLKPVVINQKLGFVDRYPWHKDQSHAEVKVELELKRQYSRNNKQS